MLKLRWPLSLSTQVRISGISLSSALIICSSCCCRSLRSSRGEKCTVSRRLAHLLNTARIAKNAAAIDENASHFRMALDNICRFFGHDLSVAKLRSRRKFNCKERAGGIFRWQKSGWQTERARDKKRKHKEAQAQGRIFVADRPIDQARIVAHDEAFTVMPVMRTHKIGGHHGRDEAGNKQRHKHRNRDR